MNAVPNHVTVDTVGSRATIRLDRPEKRNAMSYQMWVALDEACRSLAVDPAVRVVVVHGAGPHFCAGADINELDADRPAGQPGFMEVNLRAEQALADLPKPTVAALRGDVIGGGCAIALDCDIRIAAADARLGITPAKLGIVYPVSSLERLVHVVGPATAKRLLYTGELIDADAALRCGLVDRVVHPDQLDAEIDALVATLAERSLLTQSATKAMVAAVTVHGSVPGELAQRWQAIAAASGDMTEGIAAFRERRAAQFTWTPPAGSLGETLSP